MDQALADLIKISRAVGRDASLVQGGGGNTSVKTAGGKHMYIKASGAAIRDLDATKGWRRLRLAGVREILCDPRLAGCDGTQREKEIAARLTLCCEDAMVEGGRPSVESHLHALLDRCVAHLHPVAVGAYVCARQGRAAFEKLFEGEERPPLWIPYADPGYALAKAVARRVDRYAREHGRKPSVLVLAKHGLFVTGETANGVLREVRRVIGLLNRQLPKPYGGKAVQPRPEKVAEVKVAIRSAWFAATEGHALVHHFLDPAIAGFIRRNDAKALAARPPLLAEELVHAKGSPLWLAEPSARETERQLRRRTADGSTPPTSFLLRGLGLFVVGEAKTAALIREVVTASLLVRAHATRFGGPNPLTRRQREFVTGWEAEAYREKVAAGTEARELSGRIALVTGAGSGLGRAVAVGLARAGAAVALLDLDRAGAKKTAAMIAQETAGAPALPLRCDVTVEQQVAQAFDLVQRRWGGLDMLVNAASLAPPFDLVDLPLAEWQKALSVNTTGYFLAGRAAARLMMRQGMGGSIINLSSKSGLEASKSNTAYNATKAAEIHMARGWALELGEHGIRVNAVAPGNVFEGSKIWSPGYIRACARKHGIRPEEVIPFYVGRTALKRPITGQDVADAVVFLCSEKARTITGQTIVPDAGQVMVR